ncbi:hypothetical protein [Saccharopolyspora taberi]|uniref:Uncharacterized protein n=1 Tax=Saccharopolyspora taberi TaxID=60895 RepID=A0ABN3VB78_9PSEU
MSQTLSSAREDRPGAGAPPRNNPGSGVRQNSPGAGVPQNTEEAR